MHKRALVSGATGYIGARMTHRLISEGWTVHAIVRPTSRSGGLMEAGASLHTYDRTYESLRAAVDAARPAIVFHLASELQRDTSPSAAESLIASNILFGTQLVEAAIAGGCTRFLNTGTFWQHFDGHAYDPVDLYAATKQAFQDLLLFYHRVRGLSCVTVQLYDNYGPADPRRKIVNLLIDAQLGSRPLDLSAGEQVLDLTHVEDVVEGFIAASRHLLDAPQPVWEIGLLSGERLTLKDVVALVRQAIGGGNSVRLGHRPYRAREIMVPIVAPASAALAEWMPRRRLAESLPALIASRR